MSELENRIDLQALEEKRQTGTNRQLCAAAAAAASHSTASNKLKKDCASGPKSHFRPLRGGFSISLFFFGPFRGVMDGEPALISAARAKEMHCWRSSRHMAKWRSSTDRRGPWSRRPARDGVLARVSQRHESRIVTANQRAATLCVDQAAVANDSGAPASSLPLLPVDLQLLAARNGLRLGARA